jgi:hypothetical protein
MLHLAILYEYARESDWVRKEFERWHNERLRLPKELSRFRKWAGKTVGKFFELHAEVLRGIREEPTPPAAPAQSLAYTVTPPPADPWLGINLGQAEPPSWACKGTAQKPIKPPPATQRRAAKPRRAEQSSAKQNRPSPPKKSTTVAIVFGPDWSFDEFKRHNVFLGIQVTRSDYARCKRGSSRNQETTKEQQ